MAPPTDRLLVLAQATLDAVVDNWPVDAEALPELQFLTNGIIPWDGCEMLAVSIGRTAPLQEADPSLESITAVGAMLGQRFAVVDVTLIRCVPDMVVEGDSITMPSPAELEESASEILRDAQALANAILAAQKAGDLASCNSLAFEDWTPAGPAGGMGGGSQRVRMMLL